MWVCGSVDLRICGSMGPWVLAYVGLWVRGCVGPSVCGPWFRGYVCLWVRWAVGMYVCESVGLWVRVSETSVLVSSRKQFLQVSNWVLPVHFLVSFSSFFCSDLFRTKCIVSDNLNGAHSPCVCVCVWSRNYTWDCRLYKESTGYVWQLQAMYPCQNEGRLSHPTTKMCSDSSRHS